ncbi:outer membrane beta-barrel protein [bacterium]|nr:outer membrane beta-barrel protein [bacterium]MBU1993253.1 outer membrane beta-barrel protein [bacterium]
MRIAIVLSLFFCVLMYADIQQVQSLYDSGDYKKAVEEAKKSKNEYSNPQLHFLWAKSAEALGNSNEAMSAYERVILLDGDNVEAKIALVKIYKDTNRDELALQMNKSLQNYQLTPNQRTSLELLQDTNIYSLKASASLSLGYDTNINVNPGSGALDDYYITTGSIGELSTALSRFIANISYVNELEEKGGWYLRGDLKAYYQNNIDESFYNIFSGTIEAGIGYSQSDYSVYMPLSYDRVHYLEQDLSQQIRFSPRVNISFSNNIILHLNAKYTKRIFFPELFKSRDDTALAGGFGIYYLFDKNFVFFNAGYENFSADKDTPGVKFVNKDFLTASAGVNYNLSAWLIGRADYRLRYGSYEDDISTLFVVNNSKRSDTYHQIELKLSHYFAENFELYISETYAKNNSNYVPAEYDKNVVMLGLGLNY